MPGEGTIQNVRTITIANPSAGGEVVYTIPAGVWAEPVLFRAKFLTGPTAATRNPGIEYKDTGGATIFRTATITSQTASSLNTFTFFQGAEINTNSFLSKTGPLPQKVLLKENFTIETVTAAIQGSDQWSAIKLQLREYGTPDT